MFYFGLDLGWYWMFQAKMDPVQNLVSVDGPEEWSEKVVSNQRNHAEDGAEDETQPDLWLAKAVPGHT